MPISVLAFHFRQNTSSFATRIFEIHNRAWNRAANPEISGPQTKRLVAAPARQNARHKTSFNDMRIWITRHGFYYWHWCSLGALLTNIIIVIIVVVVHISVPRHEEIPRDRARVDR